MVVGDLIGEGSAQEEGVSGETPNLAARLQSIAEPGTVVLSEMTRRLVGNVFELDDLGPQLMKGFERPALAFRVVRTEEAASRFDARQRSVPLAMIGRDQELALLLERWRQAANGEGQLVLLSGEAGIGKSRVMRALCDEVTGDHLRIRYQCSPYHTDSSLYPIIQQLGAAANLVDSDTVDQKLDKLEALLGRAVTNVHEVAPLFASLLSIPCGRYPALALPPDKLRARTLQAIAEQLLGLSRRQPVLLLFEDLHWIDPTTLELLQFIVDAIAGASVLALLTTRPFVALSGFGGHSHVSRLTLNRLGRESTTSIVERLTNGKRLPEEVMNQIIIKTDGMPLFVEELTKTVLESGLLKEVDGSYVLSGPLPPLAIPSSLHDSLMARLDRLAPIKEVAQTAAVIGREFSHALLESVAPLRDNELQAGLERLIEAELIHRRGRPPDATYVFKHALVRDAAYESLLKSTRQLIHHRIMEMLERRFPGTPSEVIAQHAEEGGSPDKALHYWKQAGEHACKRSANVEAIGHLSRCLRLLATLPDHQDRLRQELAVQITLGTALIANRGYAAPEVEHAYARARELARETGATAEVLPTLYGWYVSHLVRGRHEKAIEIAGEFLELARSNGDPATVVAMRAVAWPSLCLGRLRAAKQHAEEVAALYDKKKHGELAFAYGGDPAAATRVVDAWATLLLGYPDAALTHAKTSITLGSESSHPFTLAYVFGMIACFHMMGGDIGATKVHAREAVRLSEDQDNQFWRALAMVPLGWAEAQAGGIHLSNGIDRIRDGLATLHNAGAMMFRPHFLTVLAELQMQAGACDDAFATVEEALAVISETGEIYYEPEIHRVRGELLLRRGDPYADVEASFTKGVDVARRQESRLLEQRSITSLARFFEQGGPPVGSKRFPQASL